MSYNPKGEKEDPDDDEAIWICYCGCWNDGLDRCEDCGAPPPWDAWGEDEHDGDYDPDDGPWPGVNDEYPV